MIGLSMIPGLAYILLGWMYGVAEPALIWYAMMTAVSLFGWKLYHDFKPDLMDEESLEIWYNRLSLFYYLIFILWTVIFLFYCTETKYNLHYIAIFTQIGASVVASILLVSDKRLFLPVLLFMMIPLIIYFSLIGELYGYVLSVFSTIFLGILLYSSENSYRLIQKNYHQAQHDALTGLYNRRFFVEYMERLIARLQVSNKFVYILLIDLDHFKTINDTLGHDIGDKVLQEVAERIRRYCGHRYTIARLGGDEFVIVSQEYESTEDCQSLAFNFSETLLQLIKAPYLIDDHHLYLSASIGINGVGKRAMDAQHFIKEADIAMYEAKAQGRDGIILFNDELSKRVEHHLEIERRLYFALEHNEIELRYQPQVNKHQEVVGCEVLVRWNNPEYGFVSPSEFIHIAEKTGLIIELGNYILEEAFKTLREWNARGIKLKQFSINISVRQFFHTSFGKEIETLIKTFLTQEMISQIVFEVTETILIEDIERIIQTMKRLKTMGIRFSMDDFGTGYSSLSSLREMPIDELKIDRSFVSRLGRHSADEQMVKTILTMANIFGLSTVSEGVETEEQFLFLLNNGSDMFQGYYFARPLDKEQFETFYMEHNGKAKHFKSLAYEI